MLNECTRKKQKITKSRITITIELPCNIVKGGDILKRDKPNFWIALSAIYLIFLLGFIWINNPDFLDVKNCLLLIPLYVPLFISLYLTHKNDEYADDSIWATKYSVIIVTAGIVLFKIIVNYLK